MNSSSSSTVGSWPTSSSDSDFKQPDIYKQSFAAHKISNVAIFDQKLKLFDIKAIKTHFLHGGRLTPAQAAKIIDDASQIFLKESNVVKIDRPASIIGDIHGQFYDLISILSKFAFPQDTLVFLGDYVDRGPFSTEVYLYLLLLKTHYPDSIILLRGNHESRKMTTHFTFRSECLYKYNEATYEHFLRSFMELPLAAVIQNSAFCCHGGISPSFPTIAEINMISRKVEVDYRKALCDILWADPHWDYFVESEKWPWNTNGLKTVFRGHEVQEDGYRLYGIHGSAPSLVTVFSAPNYCSTYGNLGSFIDYDGGIKTIQQYEGVPHPFVLQGFLDGINWSFPFVFELIIDLAAAVLNEIQEANLAENLTDVIQKIKAPVILARMGAEAADEMHNSEESTFSEGVLETEEPDCLKFQQAEEIDAKNETKKEQTEPAGMEGMAPSLQLNKKKLVEECIEDGPLKIALFKEITSENKQEKKKAKQGWFSRLI